MECLWFTKDMIASASHHGLAWFLGTRRRSEPVRINLQRGANIVVAHIRQLVCIPLISLLAVGMLAACDDQQRPETVENLTTTPASSVATSSSESTATPTPRPAATPTPQPTATSPVGFGPVEHIRLVKTSNRASMREGQEREHWIPATGSG